MKEFPIVIFSNREIVYTPQINISYKDIENDWLLDPTEKTKTEINHYFYKAYPRLYEHEATKYYPNSYLFSQVIDVVYRFFNKHLGNE